MIENYSASSSLLCLYVGMSTPVCKNKCTTDFNNRHRRLFFPILQRSAGTWERFSVITEPLAVLEAF